MPGTMTAEQIAGFHNEVTARAAADASSFPSWLLSLVPQEGRYSGNGDRDAWIIWQAYINRFGDGRALERDREGIAAIQQAMEAYRLAFPDDPLGILPRNDAERNGFLHDLLSVLGLASDIVNNFNFAVAEFTAWLNGADLFSLFSGPFIVIFGTAASLVSAAVQAVGTAVDFAWGVMGDLFGALNDAFNSLGIGDFINAVQDLIDGVAGIFRRFIEFIGEVVKTITPVVLDLDGDGVELISLEDSDVVMDLGGDGIMHRTGWVTPDDAILGFDADGDGLVSGVAEFSFADPANGYATDLAGLARHDSNGDGVLNSNDESFDRFLVWRDLDSDGISEAGEVQTLSEAGVTEIALALNGAASTREGNFIYNTSTWTDAAGAAHEVLDVGFLAGLDKSITQEFAWGQVTGGADGVQVNADGPIDLSAFLEEFGRLFAAGQLSNQPSDLMLGDQAANRVTGGADSIQFDADGQIGLDEFNHLFASAHLRGQSSDVMLV